MGILGSIVAFIIIWWIVLFMVLPWGVHPPDNPEPGHVASAPEKPRVITKMAITTLIAAVVFAIVWLIADAGLIDFRN
jgi:predicted secreted protein